MTRSASASSGAAGDELGRIAGLAAEHAAVSAAVVCHHCCRVRATTYSRALSIAVLAVAARAWARYCRCWPGRYERLVAVVSWWSAAPKTVAKSCFMLTTVQPFALAFVSACSAPLV